MTTQQPTIRRDVRLLIQAPLGEFLTRQKTYVEAALDQRRLLAAGVMCTIIPDTRALRDEEAAGEWEQAENPLHKMQAVPLATLGAVGCEFTGTVTITPQPAEPPASTCPACSGDPADVEVVASGTPSEVLVPLMGRLTEPLLWMLLGVIGGTLAGRAWRKFRRWLIGS